MCNLALGERRLQKASRVVGWAQDSDLAVIGIKKYFAILQECEAQ